MYFLRYFRNLKRSSKSFISHSVHFFHFFSKAKRIIHHCCFVMSCKEFIYAIVSERYKHFSDLRQFLVKRDIFENEANAAYMLDATVFLG